MMGKNQLLTYLHSSISNSKLFQTPNPHKQDSKVIPQQMFITTYIVFHTGTLSPKNSAKKLCSPNSSTKPAKKYHAPFIFHSIQRLTLFHKQPDSKSYFPKS